MTTIVAVCCFFFNNLCYRLIHIYNIYMLLASSINSTKYSTRERAAACCGKGITRSRPLTHTRPSHIRSNVQVSYIYIYIYTTRIESFNGIHTCTGTTVRYYYYKSGIIVSCLVQCQLWCCLGGDGKQRARLVCYAQQKGTIQEQGNKKK